MTALFARIFPQVRLDILTTQYSQWSGNPYQSHPQFSSYIRKCDFPFFVLCFGANASFPICSLSSALKLSIKRKQEFIRSHSQCSKLWSSCNFTDDCRRMGTYCGTMSFCYFMCIFVLHLTQYSVNFILTPSTASIHVFVS